MLYFLLPFLLITFTAVSGIENATWSAWDNCSTRCFKQRVLKCKIGGVDVDGVSCGLLDGSQAFKQIASAKCADTSCIANDEWMGPANNKTYGGNCYDADLVSTFKCKSFSGCRLRHFFRCYNETSCSGTWTRTGSSSECSASCGGGTRVWDETCRDDEGESSYNCNGTGGSTTTRQVSEACNNQPCETSQSTQTVTKNMETRNPVATEDTTFVQDTLAIPISATSCGVLLLALIIVATVLVLQNKRKRKKEFLPKPAAIESFSPSPLPPSVNVEPNYNHLGSNQEIYEMNEYAIQSYPNRHYKEPPNYDEPPEQEYSTINYTSIAESRKKENSPLKGESTVEGLEESVQSLHSTPDKPKQMKRKSASSHQTQRKKKSLKEVYSIPTKPRKKKTPKKPPPFVEDKNITEGPEESVQNVYSIPDKPNNVKRKSDSSYQEQRKKDSLNEVYSTSTKPRKKKAPKKPPPFVENKDITASIPGKKSDYVYSTPKSTAKVPNVYDRLQSGSGASLVQGGEESKNVYNIAALPPPSIVEYSHLQLPLPDSLPEDEYSEVDRMGGTHVMSLPGSIDNIPAESIVESISDSSWSDESWSDENTFGLSSEKKMKVKR